MKRVLAGLLAVAAVSAAVLTVRAFRAEQRRVSEISELRTAVYEARVDADACRNELAYEEGRFRHFVDVVDSLRADVDALEALDERGVPQARYDEYMERFDSYNDSVAAWEGRAEALRAMDQRCRAHVETHNALADSLRTRLDAMASEAGG